MAKEKKLAVTYKGEQLPAVYSTDVLAVGQIGAIVVYTHPVTANGVTTMATDSVAIRFSLADEPIGEDLLRKYQMSIPALMTAYLGTGYDYAASNIIVGKVTYEINNQKAIGIIVVEIKVDGVVVATAHYLGQSIKPTTTPSQYIWGLVPTPTVVQNIVAAALPAILQKELYGG